MNDIRLNSISWKENPGVDETFSCSLIFGMSRVCENCSANQNISWRRNCSVFLLLLVVHLRVEMSVFNIRIQVLLTTRRQCKNSTGRSTIFIETAALDQITKLNWSKGLSTIAILIFHRQCRSWIKKKILINNYSSYRSNWITAVVIGTNCAVWSYIEATIFQSF